MDESATPQPIDDYPTRSERRRWEGRKVLVATAVVLGMGAAALVGLYATNDTDAGTADNAGAGAETATPATATTLGETAAAAEARVKVEAVASGTTMSATQWADLVAPLEASRGPVSGTATEGPMRQHVSVAGDGTWQAGHDEFITAVIGDGTKVTTMPVTREAQIGVGTSPAWRDGRGRAVTEDEFTNRMLYPSMWLELNSANVEVSVTLTDLDPEAHRATWHITYGPGADKYGPDGWTFVTDTSDGTLISYEMSMAADTGLGTQTGTFQRDTSPAAVIEDVKIPAGYKVTLYEPATKQPPIVIVTDRDFSARELVTSTANARRAGPTQ